MEVGNRYLLGVCNRTQDVDEKLFMFDVFPERFRLVRGICYVLLVVHWGPGLGKSLHEVQGGKGRTAN